MKNKGVWLTTVVLMAALLCGLVNASWQMGANSGERVPAAGGKSPVTADTQKTDYGSVKEDFMCRACVVLARIVVEDVLPTLTKRFAHFTADDRSDSTRRRTNSAWKERLAVETHDAIDHLCETVKKRMNVTSESDTEAGEASKRQTTEEGIQIACAATLEELNEPLAQMVLQSLHPKYKRDTLHPGEEEFKAPYKLPTTGAFCEAEKLCKPYVHYHITSEDGARPKRTQVQQDLDSLMTSLSNAETWHKVWNNLPWGELLTRKFWSQVWAQAQQKNLIQLLVSPREWGDMLHLLLNDAELMRLARMSGLGMIIGFSICGVAFLCSYGYWWVGKQRFLRQQRDARMSSKKCS